MQHQYNWHSQIPPCLQITYKVDALDHFRCGIKEFKYRPGLTLIIFLLPIILVFLQSGPRTQSLFPFILAIGGSAFIWILIAGLCFIVGLQRSQRYCTTRITYDGIYDIAPEMTGFISWAELRAVVNDKGDVFILSSTPGKGVYIAKSGFTNEITPEYFCEAIERTRKGDYSMLTMGTAPLSYTSPAPPPQPATWPPPPNNTNTEQRPKHDDYTRP